MKVNAGCTCVLEVPEELVPTFYQWRGCQRKIYNWGLEAREKAYQDGQYLSYPEQSKSLKSLKQELPWLKEPPAQSFQQTLKHLDTGYQRFRDGLGAKPTFKKRGRKEPKIHIPQHFTITRLNRKWGQIDLPKLGKLRFRWSQGIPDEISSCAIGEKSGKWTISFSGIRYTNKHRSKVSIGIDPGINVTMATSKPVNGEHFHYLDLEKIKKLEKGIAQKQAEQAKKKKWGHRWRRLQKTINNKHSKISRLRHDWAHKLSTKIAKNHGQVFYEFSDIQEMTKSASGTKENPGTDVAKKAGLNRSILRQGWGEFFRQLDYKCDWYGGIAYRNQPYYKSQKCPVPTCHHISENNREKGTIRFRCIKCGFEGHADLVSAINQEEDGLASLAAKDGKTYSARNPEKTEKRRPKKLRTSANLSSKGQADYGNKCQKELSSLGDSHDERCS